MCCETAAPYNAIFARNLISRLIRQETQRLNEETTDLSVLRPFYIRHAEIHQSRSIILLTLDRDFGQFCIL